MRKLTIELIPKTCFYFNLRTRFSKKKWDFIRHNVYKRANYRCEICGGKGPNHPVEAHETWVYEERTHTQVLAEIVALCPACHMVKHIGLARKKGKYEEAVEHLIKVNGITRSEADSMIDRAFETWANRSKRKWAQDISFLSKMGVMPPRKRKSNVTKSSTSKPLRGPGNTKYDT